MVYTKCVKLCGIILVVAVSLWILLIGIRNSAAAPITTDTVWPDDTSNLVTLVAVGMNTKTELANTSVNGPFNVLDSAPVILDIHPTIIPNDVTTTLYITGVGVVSTSTVRIGRETIADVAVVDSDTIAVQVPPGLPPRTFGALLYDNAERDDVNLWQADAPWTRATNSAHSPTHSWEAVFTDAISASLTLSGTLDLTALPDPVLDFWHQLDLGTGDAAVAVVEVSTEPSVWLPLYTFTVSQTLWGHYQLDLRPYASHNAVSIRFRIHNQNAGGNGVCWLLDDIAVTSAAGGVALVNPGGWEHADLWQGNLVVTNQAAQFDVDLARAEQVAAVPFTITVTARGPSGYVVQDYSGSVTLSASTGDISPTIASGFVDGKLETVVQLDTIQDGVVVTVNGATDQGVSAPFDVVDRERAAYIHLEEQFDLHNRFWVYSDGGAFTNHYGISYMGVYTDVQMDAYYTPTVHSGDTAIQVTYSASDTGGLCWGGAAWLDPEGNWDGAFGGFDLRGVTELVFWAKGERGGERIKFGMGGIPEGAPARHIVVTLPDQWQRYTIPLNGLILNRVMEGFYWAANCDDNPDGLTFYIDDVHYLYHSNTFIHVFKDQFSSSNFYVPSGWMGDLDQIHIDEGVPAPTYPGATVTRFTYDSLNGPDDWAGVYYQWPDSNWGTDPDGGHDLSGATQLVFRAQGEQGGERITLGMGGITGVYGDSTGKHERTIILSSDWQEYTINFTGYDLSRVMGGFYWSASRYWNPGGATFYLDDVRYVFEEPSWPHFIQSYVADTFQPDDVHFAGSAHVYDNALAILAFLARGTEADLVHARDIADALVYAQDHDPYFTDGRLRNVYHAEALSGSGGIVWYWNDAYGAGSHVGNMSWAALALARMYQATGESKYLDAAIRLANWIHDHTYDDRFYGGYTGGYDGWEPAQTRNDWKSTEHNIDAYVAFATLYDITGEEEWWERALHAKQFVRSMWYEGELEDSTPVGWFWTGTKGDFLVYGDWEETITITNSCQPTPTVILPHNHYYPTRFGPDMDGIQLDTHYTETVHGGESSIRLLYPSGSSNWAGLIALEGEHNWGVAGPGYDMIGARSLTVWVKGAAGGETVVVGIGGVPYTTTTLPISTTLPGTYADVLSQTIILTADWQPYTITVPPTHTLDMEHHIGGFFAYLESADNPTGAEIFLDDIVYHFDDPLGEMLNYKVLVADVNSWGLMALGELPRYGKTVDWIHAAFLVTETVASQVITGCDFDIDKDGIWFEGTGQAILAFQIAGRQEWSDDFLADMVIAQEQAPRANRKGIVAALHDCLTTNLGWFYYNRLHVAPTAWYIFAAREHNPYWGVPTLADIPHQGPVVQFVTYTYPSDHLLLQGSNFATPIVTLKTSLSDTLSLTVSAYTSTTLTATLSAPLSTGITYTIILTNPDTQCDQKAFLVECLPPVGAQFAHLPLVLRTFAFTATTAGGHEPFTYTWDFGETPLALDGMAYGPFRGGQRPGGPLPDEAELREDLGILSQHTDHVRLYGTQDVTPDIVRVAAEKGISVTLGAWIDANTATNELEIASLISLTDQYSNVVAVTVGNERLLFHEIDETQLISYIQQVQSAVDVPVSTAETWDVWLSHPQLADVVDFLLVHIHPYWEGVPVEDAADRVAQRYTQVQSAYPGKPIVIGETGWPTGGDDYGAAHPGGEEQQQFVGAFIEWAEVNDVPYFYFDAFDESWKCDPGPTVECHWGLYTTERQPKPVVATSVITTVPVITHTFPVPGNYTVTLTVRNACGQDIYSDTVFVAPSPGVELTPDNISSAYPDSVVVYTHTLTNTGDVIDNFNLDVFSSQDWPVALLTNTPVTLAQNDTTIVQVSITIPVGILSGTVDVTIVTATSQTDEGIQASVANTTTVSQVAGMQLAPDRSRPTDPGQVITYIHTLTNTGNGSDAFDISHASSQDWMVTYETPISLSSGQTTTLMVSITVPLVVISGTVDTTVITATSQADSNTWASVADATTVKLVGNVALSPNRSATTVPGGQAVYTHTLTNNINITQTFVLTATSSQSYVVTVETTTTASLVARGGSALVTVTVQVPDDAISGTVDSTVVTATGSVVGSDTAIDTTAVRLVGGVSLEPDRTDSGEPGEQVVYQHTLTNTAKVSQTVNLGANSSEGWAVEVSPTSVPLVAGKRTAVVVTVTVGSDDISGTVDSTVVTATGSVVGSDTATNTTTVNHAPGIVLGPDRAGSANPDSVVIYTHTLTNTGNYTDTFDLDISPSWGALLTSTPITLAQDGTITLRVRVTIPASVLSGTADVTVITATSQTSDTVQASVTNTTTVNHTPGVELAPDHSRNADAGTVITYTHTLTNTGNYTDTFDLDISSGWGALLANTPITLAQESTTTVVVSVTVPPGVHRCTVDTTVITATSQAGLKVFATVTDTTRVMCCVYLPLVLRDS